MQPESHRVKDIAQIDPRTIGILWTDGKSDAFDVVELRRKCPCAVCIDEWTRVPKLKPEDVAETVRPVKIESVGAYALRIDFSDGHRTGIYTFNLLRQMHA